MSLHGSPAVVRADDVEVEIVADDVGDASLKPSTGLLDLVIHTPVGDLVELQMACTSTVAELGVCAAEQCRVVPEHVVFYPEGQEEPLNSFHQLGEALPSSSGGLHLFMLVDAEFAAKKRRGQCSLVRA
jgi:hypothetical protein